MRQRPLALAALLAVVATATAATPASAATTTSLSWELSDTGSTARFRGLAAVSDTVAWVSGSAGTVLRTVDGGGSWQDVSPPVDGDLEFRDIEAFSADKAVVLSIGPGTDSRVYTTVDGGATWTNTFTNEDPNAFYDCVAFFDSRHGLAMSDPVDGRFRFIRTSDGGATWTELPYEDSPAALDGEFAFAASGQCLVAADRRNGYLVTGGAATARILHTPDRGLTWTAHDTPIHSGPSAGVYAAAFRDARHGILVGGDYTTPDSAPDAAAYTDRGPGRVKLAAEAPGEYRSGVTFVLGSVAIAVGPTGSDITGDGGRTWHGFDDGSFDTVDCARGFACWAAGEKGRVGRLVWS